MLNIIIINSVLSLDFPNCKTVLYYKYVNNCNTPFLNHYTFQL